MHKLLLAGTTAAVLALPGLAAAETATLTVGFTNSETGKLNADAAPQLHGFNMWRDIVNQNGGIKVGDNRYKIELKHYDDQSKTTRVQQLYSRLITQDNVDFLFSPYSSGLTAAAAIVSEQYGKIMLTTGAAQGKPYKSGNRYLYQMYTPASLYLKSSLAAIKAKDPDAKVAVVNSNAGFPAAVTAGALKLIDQMGINRVTHLSYSPSTTDYGPIINKIKRSGATVVIGGGHYADGSTLARQLYDKNANLKMLSILVAPSVPKFASLGDAAQGVSVPSQWQPSVSFEPDFGVTSSEFVKRYKKRYDEVPGYHAMGGYATGIVLQHAIEQAGSIESDAVAKALNKMNATIAYGHIDFSTKDNQHGLQVGHSMVLAQWQKGDDGELHLRTAWPKKASDAKLVYPMARYKQQ